jgi:hypothetical protein
MFVQLADPLSKEPALFYTQTSSSEAFVPPQ